MATQQELINLVNGLIIDNNTNQVTPAKVRSVMLSIISELGVTDAASITANLPLSIDPFLNTFYIQKVTNLLDGYLSKEDFIIFSDIVNKASTSYVDSQDAIVLASANAYADTKITAVYRLKGSVANFASLPSTGQVTGDVWNLLDSGANYVWTGTVWDKLSDTVDISGKEDTSNKTDTITGNETSSSLFASIKGIVAWTTNTFQYKLIAGDNITIDNSNPRSPVINSIGGSGGGSGNLIREEFIFSNSQTFTLANNYAQVYAVEVQGGGALSTSQYTLVSSNQITINDTLDIDDYVVVLYSTAEVGVQPYYTQAQTDSLLSQITTVAPAIIRDSNGNIISKFTKPKNPIVGGFYYPRKSINPDWVSEMTRVDIPTIDRLSWADIEEDLDFLSSSNVNTVRIVIFYNLTTFGTNPLVNSSFVHDAGKEAIIRLFLDKCRERNLQVITQTNFGYEGDLSAGNLTEMQNYVDSTDLASNESKRFNNHIDWVTALIIEYKDTVILHKMFNEPDGFGTWADYDKAVTVLNFLFKIKQRFVLGYSNIPYLANAVDHVNFNLRFTEMPAGIQSIYDISDWAVFNSYYWSDNGTYPYVHYRRQFQYMSDNNYANKPLMLTECGFPSNYEGQGAGLPSFVPENGQFDRPIGSRPMTPHTQYSQTRGIKEGVYFSEKFDTYGVLCWSLYQHFNRTSDPNFFQDSFGIIASDGVPTEAFDQLNRAFTDEFDTNGIKPLSITTGSTGGGAHINGDQGYNVNDVPAGIYIPAGGGSWQSEEFKLLTPYVLSVVVSQKTQPLDNGVAIGLNYPNNGFNFFVQFEDYSNRWRLFLNNVEVAATVYAELTPGASFGLNQRVLQFDFASRHIHFVVDGVIQEFLDISDNTTPYVINFDRTFIQNGVQLFCNASTADVLVHEAYLKNNIQ